MKCKECEDVGELFVTGRIIKCPYCQSVTNEEYIRIANREELAGAIYEWYTLGYTRGKNGKKLNSITEIVEWLKQPHKPIS